MAVTKALADTYFSDRNHSNAGVWRAFDSKVREAAIAEAIRYLSSLRMTPLYTITGVTPSSQSNALDLDATTSADFPREDLATYEQALWILMLGDQIPDGTKTAPRWFSDMRKRLLDEGARKDDLAPLARHFMGWNYRGFSVARG